MRIPEPTALMEDSEQCRLYNQQTSSSDILNDYIELYKRLINVSSGTVIDLGSGTCNFVIALADYYPNLKFICYEASSTMIDIAKLNIKNNKLENRITIIQDLLENAHGDYDVVLANRVLHHVDNTDKFWKTINNLSNSVLVVDIDRPPDEIINKSTDSDLVNSMRAAYTFDEVYRQVRTYKYTVLKDNSYKLIVYHTK